MPSSQCYPQDSASIQLLCHVLHIQNRAPLDHFPNCLIVACKLGGVASLNQQFVYVPLLVGIVGDPEIQSRQDRRCYCRRVPWSILRTCTLVDTPVDFSQMFISFCVFRRWFSLPFRECNARWTITMQAPLCLMQAAGLVMCQRKQYNLQDALGKHNFKIGKGCRLLNKS